MINKLKIKFVFINMILILIILSFTFSAVYISTSNRLLRESNDLLQKTIEQENEIHKKEINAEEANSETPPPQPQIFTFAAQLDKSNNITDTFYNNFEKLDTNTLINFVNAALNDSNATGYVQNKNYRFLKRTNEKGIKIAFSDRASEVNTLQSLFKTSILVGIGSLIAFFLVSLYLANWAVKPIKKSWEQQRQFVADASHELKTPLTVILANTDIILAHKEETIMNQIKWIDYIKTEAQRMTSLVNDLLFLAKTDANINSVIFSKVNFSDIVWNCILPFECVVFEEEKTLESKIDPDVFINGDNNSLKQLIVILIDNAIKYCDEKGHIIITLTQNIDKILLSITNTGEPIPKEQIEHIFKRFYRVDKSRSKLKDGYGLGLSIAKSIVESHHGKISVKSCQDKGTTFTVSFLTITKTIR